MKPLKINLQTLKVLEKGVTNWLYIFANNLSSKTEKEFTFTRKLHKFEIARSNCQKLPYRTEYSSILCKETGVTSHHSAEPGAKFFW